MWADGGGVSVFLVGDGWDWSEGLSAGHDVQQGVDVACVVASDDGWKDVDLCLFVFAGVVVAQEGVCVAASDGEDVSALFFVFGGECAHEAAELGGGVEGSHVGFLPCFVGESELWVGGGVVVVDVSGCGLQCVGCGVDVELVGCECLGEVYDGCCLVVPFASVQDADVVFVVDDEDAGGEVLHFGDKFAECPVWEDVCGVECGSWVGDDDLCED